MINEPYDRDGAAAVLGTVNIDAAASLFSILSGQSVANRSLGTGDDVTSWIGTWKDRIGGADLMASCADAIARTVASSPFVSIADEILLAGGGAFNRTVVNGIAGHSSATVRLTDDLGVPVQSREAMAMAILGALSADGVSITLPQISGCSTPSPVAGVWIRP